MRRKNTRPNGRVQYLHQCILLIQFPINNKVAPSTAVNGIFNTSMNSV